MVHVYIHPHMSEIIDNLGKKDPEPDSFTFDFMEEGATDPEQECRNVNQAIKTINK